MSYSRNEIMNKMRLYQHSARCPIALRSFLECNPDYWCFIPQLWYEANEDNLIHFRGTSSSSSSTSCSSLSLSLSSDADREETDITMMNAINRQRIFYFLDHVPIPPGAYAFSYRQHAQQRLFFEKYLSLPPEQLPYSTIDLYQVAIIAVCKSSLFTLFCFLIDKFSTKRRVFNHFKIYY